jgi:hypothetical protein
VTTLFRFKIVGDAAQQLWRVKKLSIEKISSVGSPTIVFGLGSGTSPQIAEAGWPARFA